LDTASAVVDGDGRKVEWTSPHARMPRHVPVRIRLDTAVFGDSAVVMQDGIVSPLQADGSYVIDFMKLRLDVYPKGTVAITPAPRLQRTRVSAHAMGQVVRIRGLATDVYTFTLHTATGRLL